MALFKFNQKETEPLETGFGSRVSDKNKQRLLNHDGSFNVERRGFSFFRSINAFHLMLTIPWWKFHALLLGFFVGVNMMFAVLYMLIGIEGVVGIEDPSLYEQFWDSFFFSVQTFTSVGYGILSPGNFITDIVSSLEAFVGLLSFALATGLLFARFSRPTAQIIFSNNAIITPFKDMTSLQFRIVNERKDQLIEAEVKLLFSYVEDTESGKMRRYRSLPLQVDKVVFFPLHWTIVHPIDKDSILYGMKEADLINAEAEFLIQFKAIDDTFSQTVHTRSSYRYDEVKWNQRFVNMYDDNAGDKITVDLKKIHELEPL